MLGNIYPLYIGKCYMQKTEILKAIGSIGKQAAKITRDVQACAVECVIHAVLHGDVTLADQLVDALGKQGRKASLRAWFELNGCMFIAKGKQTFSYDKTHKLGKADTQSLREALMSKPWEEAKPEAPAVSVLEIGAKFDKFMDVLTKQAKDATSAGIPVHGKALLDHMVKAAAEFHAREILSEKYDLVEEDVPATEGIIDSNKAARRVAIVANMKATEQA